MFGRVRDLWRRARRQRGWRELSVGFHRALRPRGKRSIVVLLAGLFAIVVWQASFASPRAKVDSTYKVTASSGVHQDSSFVYFLYYLDLFPVISTANLGCNSLTQPGCYDLSNTPADYSESAAKEVLLRRGSTLQQDFGWTWNAGDRGKIYLYLFDAWLKGKPMDPTPRAASRLAFIVALGALWGSLWYLRRPVLGATLVVLLGSNPFQLYETHVHANVFSWNITIAILLLAIHLPLLRRWRPHPTLAFLWPVASALLLSCVRTIRSEPATIVLAVAITYLFVSGFTWRRRLAMVAVLGVTLWSAGQLWQLHFLRQHNHAAKVIAQHGGHPFPVPLRMHHQVWHPIWCGLGDFGKKYGYEWQDHAAAAYAKPFMEAKGVYVPSGYLTGTFEPKDYYDPETRIYKKLPYDQPYYEETIRAKVLGDIKKDPGWYLGVLWKRAKRIMTATTPIRVSWSSDWKNVPWSSTLVLPIIGALALLRSRFLFGLALFTVPTVTTAFVIFSDLGTTYYGVFHIIACAIVVSSVVQHAWYWGRREIERRRRTTPAEPSAAA